MSSRARDHQHKSSSYSLESNQRPTTPAIPPEASPQARTASTLTSTSSSSTASASTTRTNSPRGLKLAEKQKYIAEYAFPYCDLSSKYEKIAKIGQGTFG